VEGVIHPVPFGWRGFDRPSIRGRDGVGLK
jgi:hypothetical protein